jgi:hypothetical protein
MYDKWQIYNSLQKLPSYWLKIVAAAEYALSVIRNTGSTKREKNYTLAELGDLFHIDYQKDRNDQVLRIKRIDPSLRRLVDQRFQEEFERLFQAANKRTSYQNTLENPKNLPDRKRVILSELWQQIKDFQMSWKLTDTFMKSKGICQTAVLSELWQQIKDFQMSWKLTDTFMKSKGIETANTWFQGARTRPTLEMLWETMVSGPPMKEEEKNGSQSDGWPGCGSRRV